MSKYLTLFDHCGNMQNNVNNVMTIWRAMSYYNGKYATTINVIK